MTLDELNVMIKAANGEWFGEKLDKKVRKLKLFNIVFSLC
jgi:hypothetical protein